MYKKILYSIAFLAIVGFAAFNTTMHSNRYGLSDVSLENVQALAQQEGGSECFSDCHVQLFWVCYVYYTQRDWEVICDWSRNW